MKKQIKIAFGKEIQTVEVCKILRLRKVPKGTKSTKKYRQIAASIREVGIIEPIVVHPHGSDGKQYLLLEGYLRLEVLLETDTKMVECLIADDDEAFTYNHKVNRLSAIQEHFMIIKAIKNGVSEQAIASALDVDVTNIGKKRDLLIGICAEAVKLLKGRYATAGAFSELRKVKPMRQIEMAELMNASHNFSVNYVKCLVAATSEDQLLDKKITKNAGGLSTTDMARMEREMKSLSGDFRQIEESHGKNVLNLVIVVGYLKKLLDNARVVRFIAENYPEILSEFQKIVASRSLDD